jgi:hypothetical protein
MNIIPAQIARSFKFERLRGKLLSEPGFDALFIFRDREDD